MFINQEMLGNTLDALALTAGHNAPVEDGQFSAGWVTGYFDALAAVGVVIGKDIKIKQPAIVLAGNGGKHAGK
jgi:hypothetical protein